MLTFLKKLRRDERGVSALEYAILAAVIVAAVTVGAKAIGPKVTETFSKVATDLTFTPANSTTPK